MITSFDEIEPVFRQEFPRLVAALSLVSNDLDAADAVQEAFVVALVRWERISRLDDPVGWIRRVAVNRVANTRRDRRNRSRILEERWPRSHEGAAVAPEDQLDAAAAIAGLPTKQRLAVSLHYVAGYSITEVARLLGVAEGTVKSNLSDARRSLRTVLEGSHG